MMAVRDADKNRMLIKYGEIGCIDAQIACEPRFTNQLGVVDLVYKIEEREPYMLGELEIEGNGRTKDKVIRREAVMAGLLPGEVLDKNRIEIFRRRLMRSGVFHERPAAGQADQDRDRESAAQGQALRRLDDAAYLQEVTQARMQDPGSGADLVPAPPPGPGAAPGTTAEPNVPGLIAVRHRIRSARRRIRCRRSTCPPAGPPVAPGAGCRPFRNPAPPPVGTGEPPATFPSIPGMNMTDVGPDRNDPFPTGRSPTSSTSVEESPNRLDS